jgi:hypothetical protein
MAQIENHSPSTKSGAPESIVIIEGYEFQTDEVEIDIDEDGLAHCKIKMSSHKGRKITISLGHSEIKKIADALAGRTIIPFELYKAKIKAA